MIDRICAIIIIIGILIFPTSGVPVSPTVMFEMGTAYHMAGRVAEARACYKLVLEWEKHFKHSSTYLPKYKQMAVANLRVIRMDAIRDRPFFRRGK